MPLPGPSCGMSVRLPSPGRSLLTHAHICESINVALTRNLFDDRSESAWHFLNSGWHSPAGSGSQLQSGARSRGSGELAGMRTRSHPHSAPRLGDPAAQAGWLSRFLEGEKGARPGSSLPVTCGHLTSPPTTAPCAACTWAAPVTALVTLGCNTCFLAASASS